AMNALLLISIFVTIRVTTFAESSKINWSFHGRNGPSHWSKSYPICSNKRQSPINIPLFKKDFQPSLKASLKFSHYTCPCRGDFVMRNNGKTLQIDVRNAIASLTLNRERRYMLDHLHFHWGSNNQIGSEHHFEGRSFPAELHFVHYNIEFHNLSVAIDKANALAVLGVMIQVGKRNSAFDKFLKYLHRVKDIGQGFKIPAFDVKSLLPKDTGKFYRYEGSLTTPPCFDNVTWTVLYDPVEISHQQLEKFRALRDNLGHALVNNFRPVQELNGRSVSSSFRLFNRIH
ncbi:Hypothetical predicted protein, partial [Paramuricea clavata]